MTGDVPAPRRNLPWRPPESKWAGRALFFASGLAACFASVLLTGALLSGLQGRVFAALAVTAILTVAIVTQRVRHGPRWRWMSFVAGVVALPALLFAVLVAGPAVRHWTNQRDFDATAWAADAAGANSVRVWMVDDLRERHPLEGLTRAEVEALLGAPDWVDAEAPEVEYVLGYDDRFLLDPLVLRLEFGPQGRVIRVSVYES